jgi:CheY-like chemotaxis protein
MQGKRSIIVAVDNEDDRMILEVALDEVGYAREYRFLSSGEELLDHLEQKGEHTEFRLPDVIVLDLNESNTWRDTLRKIKSNPALGRIPVLLLATPDEEDHEDRSFPGVDVVVIKPIEFHKYVESLKTALMPYCQG